ncbi:MAG: ABC transporter permease [Gammaproteobacteria bacterium]|nr:ABC transporter permease [Gammaproteobacteria bacterium]
MRTVGVVGRVVAPGSNARALLETWSLLKRYRELIIEMMRREVYTQYGRQALGAWWIIGHPFFLMMIYVTVFTLVFRVRLDQSVEMPRDYLTYLMSGLIPWMTTQQCLSRGPSLLVGNANLVKQVVFPIGVIPVANVFLNLAVLVVGIGILLLYMMFAVGGWPWTVLLLPIVAGLHIMGLLGIGFGLAALGVFARDLKDVIQVLCIAGIYMMPIFYLPEWVPAPIKPLLYVNPFSYMGWVYQDVLYYGRFEHPASWFVFVIGSFVLCGGGYRLFKRLSPQFGNAL